MSANVTIQIVEIPAEQQPAATSELLETFQQFVDAGIGEWAEDIFLTPAQPTSDSALLLLHQVLDKPNIVAITHDVDIERAAKDKHGLKLFAAAQKIRISRTTQKCWGTVNNKKTGSFYSTSGSIDVIGLLIYNQSRDTIWHANKSTALYSGFYNDEMLAEFGCPCGQYDVIANNTGNIHKCLANVIAVALPSNATDAIKLLRSIIQPHTGSAYELLTHPEHEIVAEQGWAKVTEFSKWAKQLADLGLPDMLLEVAAQHGFLPQAIGVQLLGVWNPKIGDIVNETRESQKLAYQYRSAEISNKFQDAVRDYIARKYYFSADAQNTSTTKSALDLEVKSFMKMIMSHQNPPWQSALGKVSFEVSASARKSAIATILGYIKNPKTDSDWCRDVDDIPVICPHQLYFYQFGNTLRTINFLVSKYGENSRSADQIVYCRICGSKITEWVDYDMSGQVVAPVDREGRDLQFRVNSLMSAWLEWRRTPDPTAMRSIAAGVCGAVSPVVSAVRKVLRHNKTMSETEFAELFDFYSGVTIFAMFVKMISDNPSMIFGRKVNVPKPTIIATDSTKTGGKETPYTQTLSWALSAIRYQYAGILRLHNDLTPAVINERLNSAIVHIESTIKSARIVSTEKTEFTIYSNWSELMELYKKIPRTDSEFWRAIDTRPGAARVPQPHTVGRMGTTLRITPMPKIGSLRNNLQAMVEDGSLVGELFLNYIYGDSACHVPKLLVFGEPKSGPHLHSWGLFRVIKDKDAVSASLPASLEYVNKRTGEWIQETYCDICHCAWSDVAKSTVATTITMVDEFYDSVNLFNYYAVNCPVYPSGHVYHDGACKCGITRDKIKMRDKQYFNKYFGEFSKLHKKHTHITKIQSQTLLMDQVQSAEFAPKTNVKTFIQQTYGMYAEKWSRMKSQGYENICMHLGSSAEYTRDELLGGKSPSHPIANTRERVLDSYAQMIIVTIMTMINHANLLRPSPDIVELAEAFPGKITLPLYNGKHYVDLLSHYTNNREDFIVDWIWTTMMSMIGHGKTFAKLWITSVMHRIVESELQHCQFSDEELAQIKGVKLAVVAPILVPDDGLVEVVRRKPGKDTDENANDAYDGMDYDGENEND